MQSGIGGIQVPLTQRLLLAVGKADLRLHRMLIDLEASSPAISCSLSAFQRLPPRGIFDTIQSPDEEPFKQNDSIIIMYNIINNIVCHYSP